MKGCEKMARVVEPISETELKRMTVANLRNEYRKLSEFYQKIINEEVVYCPQCGKWKNVNSFYSSNSSPDGIEHYACKECILNMMTDFDKKTNIRVDNKEKTVAVLKRLDWYFEEKTYNDQLDLLANGVGEKIRGTAAQQWIVMLKSLPQYRDKKFSDSKFEFVEDDDNIRQKDPKIVKKTIERAEKRFGAGYSNDDLMFLENEYQDWITRYECNTKAQETIFERLAFKKWEINKATKAGQSTKDLDKTYTELLSSINILPKQNAANGLSDSLSFGQMIEQWEEHDPVFEPEPEFADVDNIGKYIRVWFKGHLARALGLDNGYSREYDEYIKQYSVEKPEYNEDGREEGIYQTLFGSDGD